MVKISTIEENLDKINTVYNFIGLLEIHYSMLKDKFLPDIRNAKECLKKAITLWAQEIEDKINHQIPECKDNKSTSLNADQIIYNTNQCLKHLDAFLKEKKFKNIESLELELKEFIGFLENYSDQIPDILASNKYELKTLKSKILFLTS